MRISLTLTRYNPRKIGALVRHMRKKASMSRENLGAHLDLDGSSITRIEGGTHRISLEDLMKTAKVCGFKLCVSAEPKVT